MGLKLEHKEGDTLLSPEELDQIIAIHITNREQLDEVEQNNIEDAFEWLLSKKFKGATVLLSRKFQDELHKRMLGKVWKWAGKIRSIETNIGVVPYEIETNRQHLIDDTLFWIQKSTYEPLEIAMRFHHRLVQIHCYHNGNGRHSRIMADLILDKIFNLPAIIWKGENFINSNDFRDQYISALKLADQGDYKQLFACIKR
jgi:Fic-DOC domain mobile mystery protein B